jgi:hypothetical protein
MDGDSPDLGMSNDDVDDDDNSGRSVVLGGMSTRIENTDAVLVGSSQYVNGAEEVCVPLLQHGGGMEALLSSAAEAHAAKATSERRRQRRTRTGPCHRVVARDRAWTATMSSRRLSRMRITAMATTRIVRCEGCHNSSL